MKSLYLELNGSYVEVGEVKIPELVSTETNYEIGFWGQKHKEYLKQNHRVIHYNLLTSGKLNSYLHKIDVQAKRTICSYSKMYDAFNQELHQIHTDKGIQEIHTILKKVYAARALMRAEKHLNSFVRSGHSIREQ